MEGGAATGIGVLVLQLMVIAATGYVFSIITEVMGKREFGKLIKVTAGALCAVVALQLIAELMVAAGSFIKLLIRFLQSFTV